MIPGPGHLVLSQTVCSHCLEVHMDEGAFPVGSLDEVTHFCRLKYFDSMSTDRLDSWPLEHKILPGKI